MWQLNFQLGNVVVAVSTIAIQMHWFICPLIQQVSLNVIYFNNYHLNVQWVLFQQERQYISCDMTTGFTLHNYSPLVLYQW